MIIFITVGILAGLIYSRNISRPILNIVDNIDSLEKDKELTIIDRKNIYSSVYESMKKLKNRLNAAKAEQAKNEKLREEWISNISHDMKTPLTTIKGYAEIMTDPEYEVSPEEQVEFSEIITRNVEVIEGLVKDLNLSRLLKAGKVNMVKEQIDICQLLKECCDNMNIKYKDRIQTNFEHEKILIHADQNYLRRVFLNIICNAFIHNRDDVQVLICCYEKKNNAIIEISDNGKGMSQEDLENIFSRYYRGRASTEIDGSGLGMAIAYEIVKAHQGKIEIKSTQGQGTTFCIYLRK
jgi:signal transduction histidine kinase